MFRLAPLLLVPLLLLFSITNAKTSMGVAQLTGEKTEYFLSKFAFGIGSGTVEATFWTLKPYLENARSLNIYVYCDEEWEKAKTVYTCVDKIKLARETVMIDLNDGKFTTLKNELKMKVGLDIDGAANIKKGLNHYIRTHYWYAFLADCSLEMYEHQVPPIYFNVTMMNENNQHLPADEKGLWEIHLFSLIIMSIGLFFICMKTWSNIAATKSIHLIVVVLIIAIICSILSSFFELIHLSAYTRNGYGFHYFDVMSSLMEACNDFIVSFVLIAIGCGWTISSGRGGGGSMMMNHMHHPFDPSKGSHAATKSCLSSIKMKCSNPIQFILKPSIESVLFIVLFILHMSLVFWSSIGYHDDFDKFHDHEHLPGKIVMWLRVSLCVFFIVATTNTMKNDVGGDMISFMRLYRTIGAIWFICMPLFIFVAERFAQYLRHPIVTGGTLTIQSTTLCVMGWLFVGSKNTLYFKRSTVGATSGGGLGGLGGLGIGAGLDSGTKTTFKLMGSSVRTHCD
jgi:hypothetical protein